MARVLLLKAACLRNYHAAAVPPLGLMWLASVLRTRGGHEVALVDTRLAADWQTTVRHAVESFRPDVVGISAITFEREHAAALTRAVKRWKPGVRVMLGGPHATAVPHAALAESGADAVVVGEGEEIVIPLVEALAAREVPSLRGVVTTATPADADVAEMAPMPDLASLPLPAWDLVDLDAYARLVSMCSLSPWRYAVVSTSRGCPWRCTYCHNIHGKRLRLRPLESVREEFDLLQRRLGTGVIEILDDNFNARPERGKQLLELFCATGGKLQPAFPNGVRSDHVDAEMLDLMARSRTRFISFAIETASPEVQRRIRKNLDLDAARRAIEGAAARKLFANGFFMLGFPGETLSQLLQTVRFSLSVPLAQALFFRVVPMPGSELWDSLDPATRQRLEGIDDYFLTTRNVSAVSDATLAAVYRLAWLAFYSRPGPVSVALRYHRPKLLGFASSLLFGSRKAPHGR